MKYPEHEKMKAIKDKSQAVGEFLEWLDQEKGYEIAHYPMLENSKGKKYQSERLLSIMTPSNKLLAEFFEINLDEIKKEKQQMIDEMRKAKRCLTSET